MDLAMRNEGLNARRDEFEAQWSLMPGAKGSEKTPE
jgi:hypothetical protein